MMMVDYRDGDMLHFETAYSGNSLVREKTVPALRGRIRDLRRTA